MHRRIKKAAVIGSGVMGAGISALLANCGIYVELLDIVPEALSPDEEKNNIKLEHTLFRSKLAIQAKERLVKSKRSLFYTPENAHLITPGNLEDDLYKLSEVDWIIEVIIERMDVKKSFFEKIHTLCKSNTIISTNTSGLSINEMAKTLPENFRKNFLGVHFFNPPTYMKLLEIIPGEETLPDVVNFMCDFGRTILGKGVVIAKDTPNFIANRIGVYSTVNVMRAMVDMGLTVEETDAITGPPLGRPKSAVLRTSDMVGLDLALLVSGNIKQSLKTPEEQALFDLPNIINTMVENNQLGDKTGEGFYKKTKVSGKKEILTLDFNTMKYRPQKKVEFESLKQTKECPTLKERLNTLVSHKDSAGKLAWRVTKEVIVYAAEHADEIAYSLPDVDNALKWGFNWTLGPFEISDALGVKNVVNKMKEKGEEIPGIVKNLLDAGHDSFYCESENGMMCFDPKTSQNRLIPLNDNAIVLNSIKQKKPPIKDTPEISFVDLGDGVAGLEFHTINNVAPANIAEMIQYAVTEVEKNWIGLVIGHQGKNFCVGANLKHFLSLIENKKWDIIEKDINDVQQAMLKLKYCTKIVVAAPHGMALGGGAELVLHAHRVRAAADLVMGLVEMQVGLIPAGGGLTEMVQRSTECLFPKNITATFPIIKNIYNQICMAAVANSAQKARQLKYLRDIDEFTANKEGLISDAKETVLFMDRIGYRPIVQKGIEILGPSAYASLQMESKFLQTGGYISEYTSFIADKIAYIMTGGSLPAKTIVTEQYLLDLEREAFLALCGDRKTQDRIKHMLEKGKPLNN